MMPTAPDNRNRRLLAGVIVIAAAVGGVLATGTPAMWFFDAVAVVGTVYVLGSKRKKDD